MLATSVVAMTALTQPWVNLITPILVLIHVHTYMSASLFPSVSSCLSEYLLIFYMALSYWLYPEGECAILVYGLA